MGILKFAANEIVGSWPGLQPHLWASTWALEWLGPDHNLPSGACGAQGLADLEEPAPHPASALCWVGQGPRPRPHCPTIPPLLFHSLDFDHGKQEADGPLDPELGVGTQRWGAEHGPCHGLGVQQHWPWKQRPFSSEPPCILAPWAPPAHSPHPLTP